MPATQQTEGVATAAIIALIAGLLLPKALFVSLDRALLAWIVACIGSGMVLGGTSGLSITNALGRSIIPAATLPLSYIGFLTVRWTLNRLVDFDAPRILIPGPAGGFIPMEVEALPFLALLALTTFLASYLFIGVASLASRSIIAAGLQIYGFGANRLQEVRRIVTALVGIAAAIILLWSAFG